MRTLLTAALLLLVVAAARCYHNGPDPYFPNDPTCPAGGPLCPQDPCPAGDVNCQNARRADAGARG